MAADYSLGEILSLRVLLKKNIWTNMHCVMGSRIHIMCADEALKNLQRSRTQLYKPCVCVCVSICRPVWCQRHWAVTETAHHEAVWAQQEVPPCLLPGQPQTSCGSDACSSSLPCMPPSQLVRNTVAQINEVSILLSPLALCDVTLEPDHNFEPALIVSQCGKFSLRRTRIAPNWSHTIRSNT